MPEGDAPSFEVARARIPVEPDTSKFDEWLDRTDARLDALIAKARQIIPQDVAEGTSVPRGTTPAEPGVVQEGLPPTKPDDFAARSPLPDTVIDREMDKALEKNDRQRMLDLLQRQTEVLEQIESRLSERQT